MQKLTTRAQKLLARRQRPRPTYLVSFPALKSRFEKLGFEIRFEVWTSPKGSLYSVWVRAQCGLLCKLENPGEDPRGASQAELQTYEKQVRFELMEIARQQRQEEKENPGENDPATLT